MKRFWKFFFSILLCVMAFEVIGQGVELKFSGTDIYGNYVRLDNVYIENQSRNWTETLTWPDTTLLMMNLVDIAENEDQLFPFVGQNVPNPFDGVTELAVNLAEGGSLHLSVYTVSGMLLSDFIGELSTGIHRFRIQVAQPQACVVVARSGARQGSAKILNNGHGTVDRVEYLGIDGFVQKGLSVEPFGYGDQMRYTGSATISGSSRQSVPVTQAQNGSETITLVFKSTPQVTTTTVSASDVTDVSATCGGNVTHDGGATVTERGVYWGTSPNPEVNGSRTSANGSGTGSFTVSLTGLTPNTTYYVKAYATNSVGTGYGSEVSFTTNSTSSFTCGTTTLTDVDGNTYNTVQIGQQCWMKENLRTTHYADHTEIPAGSTYSDTDPYRYAPNNDEGNVPTYGYLYNWSAVMWNSSSSSANPSGVQGICPNGWHVPSDAEWTQLTDYVSSQSRYVCGSDNTYIAKALASTTGWSSSTNTCAVGNTPSNNNATGFGAFPAGFYYGTYDGFGGYANFWSATEDSGSDAYYRSLSYDGARVYRYPISKNYGFSVRCLRD